MVAAREDAERDAATTVSMEDLGRGSRLVREVAETGRVAVVTENGIEVAVVLDINAYRALRSASGQEDLRRTLLTAMAEVEAGALSDDAEVLADVRAELEGLVSAEVLAELDQA
jgi:prevent-host-death family protein